MNETINIECDENVRVLIAASHGDKVWAGQVVLGEPKVAGEHYDTQTKGLVASTKRVLIKEGIIK